jgi:hypothetical protein
MCFQHLAVTFVPRTKDENEMVPEEDKQVKSKYLIYLLYTHFED